MQTFGIILENIDITSYLYSYNRESMCIAHATMTCSQRKKILTTDFTMTSTTLTWTRTFYLMNAFGISIGKIFIISVGSELLVGEGRTLRSFRIAGVFSSDSSFSACSINEFLAFEVATMQNNIIMMTTKFFLTRAM